MAQTAHTLLSFPVFPQKPSRLVCTAWRSSHVSLPRRPPPPPPLSFCRGPTRFLPISIHLTTIETPLKNAISARLPFFVVASLRLGLLGRKRKCYLPWTNLTQLRSVGVPRAWLGTRLGLAACQVGTRPASQPAREASERVANRPLRRVE